MAPISDGMMYPSAKQPAAAPANLRVLSLEPQFTELPLHYLVVLQNYLGDTKHNDTSIELFTIVDTPVTRRTDGVTVVTPDTGNLQAIVDEALAQNIDVIHDPNGLFTKTDRFKYKDSFAFTTAKEKFATQIESYLTGHGIAWQFYEPIWHNSWIYKYSRSGGLSQLAAEFINTAQQKNYNPKQLAYVRSLANKAMQIAHAREQLYFYLQLKRSAYRQHNLQNDYSFELVYHLSNYTVFICGITDVLARLINDLYGLGYGQFQSYSIEKADFIAKLKPKRSTLAAIFNLKKYQNWAGWMKTRRNNLAHEAHIYLTPLIQLKKKPLTDTELEQKIDESFDWQAFQGAGMDEHLAGLRAIMKQNLDIQLNYDQVVTDMMTLERVDPKTKQAKTYIIFPLRTIDEDYAKISEIIGRAIKNLSSARKQKP